METRPLTQEEIGPRYGQPGHDPQLNRETRKRTFQSFFAKNIQQRWHPERDKHRILASEEFLKHLAKSEGGYATNLYEDSPPPAHYTAKDSPNLSRLVASEWLANAQKSVGARRYWVLRLAMVCEKTLPEIYDIVAVDDMDRLVIASGTKYRRAWKIVNDAFDALDEFVTTRG